MKQHSSLENTAYSQAGYDLHAGQKIRSDKKRNSIIETWEMPIWPKLSKILFISMLILTFAMALAEIQIARRTHPFDRTLFLQNISLTLMCIWGIYTLLITICSLAGSMNNKRAYYRKKEESGIQDSTNEEKSRSARAVRRLNAQYKIYTIISLSGLLVLFLFYVVFHLL